jgi:thioesterase domain-containing protein
MIDADLHLVTSEDLAGPEADARRALWAGATTGRLAIHPGYGPHTDMIFREHLAGNARVIRTILDRFPGSRTDV